MQKSLVYNFSGELDDISQLFPNERLGRLAGIAAGEGVAVEIRDAANLEELASFGPGFMKNLGELGFVPPPTPSKIKIPISQFKASVVERNSRR